MNQDSPSELSTFITANSRTGHQRWNRDLKRGQKRAELITSITMSVRIDKFVSFNFITYLFII